MQQSKNQPFTIRVLVIGRYELQLASLLNFLYEAGYDSIGALKNEEALHFFDEHDPHIVIMTNHVDEMSRITFKKIFIEKKETLTIFDLDGGISALKLLLENWEKDIIIF